MRAGADFLKGFSEGAHAQLSGAGLLFRRGKLLFWAAIPIALTLLALVLLVTGANVWIWRVLADWQAANGGWWRETLRWLAMVVAVSAMLVAAYLAFLPLRALIAAPFNDVLSLRTESVHLAVQGARGAAHGEGSFRGGLRAVADTLRLLAAEYGAYLLTLPLLLIPFVGVAAFWAVRSYFAGVNAMDIALSCRGFTYAEKKRVFRGNRGRLIGLGLATTLFDMTILLAVVSLPASVVGGTLICQDLHERGLLPGGGHASRNP